METPVKYNGPARVTVYENGDVDVRLPRENEGLKLQKVKETQAGSLTRTQGKQPILQLRGIRWSSECKNVSKITCLPSRDIGRIYFKKPC